MHVLLGGFLQRVFSLLPACSLEAGASSDASIQKVASAKPEMCSYCSARKDEGRLSLVSVLFCHDQDVSFGVEPGRH